MRPCRRRLSRLCSRPAVRLAAVWLPVLLLAAPHAGAQKAGRGEPGPELTRILRPGHGSGEHKVALRPVRSPLPLLVGAPDDGTEAVLDLAYVGEEGGPLPAAVYNGVSPDGRIYRVAVSYVTDDGRHAAGGPGAAWLWLAGGGRLSALERRSDWDEEPAARRALDAALARALDAAEALDAALDEAEGSLASDVQVDVE